MRPLAETEAEERIHQRTEEAKAILRQLQRVLSDWVEGATLKESAERIGCSEASIERHRRLLRLVRADGGRGTVKAIGRSCELKFELVEVRR